MRKNIVFVLVMVGITFCFAGNLQAGDKFSNEPMVEEQTLQELCEFASFLQ